MNETKEKWEGKSAVEEVEVLNMAEFVEPEEVKVSAEKMLQDFVRGKEQQKGIWEKILATENFDAVMKMEKPAIGSELWSRIVFDAIAAFGKGMQNEVIEGMIPLWSARNYSFVQETQQAAHKEAEERIAGQAKVFFKNRSYLTDKI